MTTRSVEAIHAIDGKMDLETFGDWRRYRSAFNEAIGLPAMSEHLPGVTMTVHLAVSHRSERQALSGHLRAGSPGSIVVV